MWLRDFFEEFEIYRNSRQTETDTMPCSGLKCWSTSFIFAATVNVLLHKVIVQILVLAKTASTVHAATQESSISKFRSIKIIIKPPEATSARHRHKQDL